MFRKEREQVQYGVRRFLSVFVSDYVDYDSVVDIRFKFSGATSNLIRYHFET